jgi:hypothetical protein
VQRDHRGQRERDQADLRPGPADAGRGQQVPKVPGKRTRGVPAGALVIMFIAKASSPIAE